MVCDGTHDSEKIVVDYPTIILLRHGETKWNVEGRYQGQLDSPLTSKGKEQAKRNALKLKKHLEVERSYKLFSSPLGRARESAFIVCETLGFSKEEIVFDNRLKEFHYGLFEGKTKEECARLYPRELAEREADKLTYILEGGESYEMVNQRLYSWLESVKKEKIIIVVAHEMINRALRGIYASYDNKTMLTLRQANDLVLKLENRAEYILN